MQPLLSGENQVCRVAVILKEAEMALKIAVVLYVKPVPVEVVCIYGAQIAEAKSGL